MHDNHSCLNFVQKTLLMENGKLHIRDLQDKMVEYGLIHQNAKSLANLEAILYKEVINSL